MKKIVKSLKERRPNYLMEKVKITPEEKELLRQLMEDDILCSKWDFFAGAGLERPVPPPEYFMRGSLSELVYLRGLR